MASPEAFDQKSTSDSVLVKIHFLTDLEKESVVQVLQRNEKIRKQESERRRRLRQELDRLESSCATSQSPLAALTRSCPRCEVALALLVRGACDCCLCRLTVCRSCVHLFRDSQLCLCSVCYQKLLYESKTGNWMNLKSVMIAAESSAVSATAQAEEAGGELLSGLLARLSAGSPVGASRGEDQRSASADTRVPVLVRQSDQPTATYRVYQVSTKRFIDSPPPRQIDNDEAAAAAIDAEPENLKDGADVEGSEMTIEERMRLHLEGSSDIVRRLWEHQARFESGLTSVAVSKDPPAGSEAAPGLLVDEAPLVSVTVTKTRSELPETVGSLTDESGSSALVQPHGAEEDTHNQQLEDIGPQQIKASGAGTEIDLRLSTPQAGSAQDTDSPPIASWSQEIATSNDEPGIRTNFSGPSLQQHSNNSDDVSSVQTTHVLSTSTAQEIISDSDTSSIQLDVDIDLSLIRGQASVEDFDAQDMILEQPCVASAADASLKTRITVSEFREASANSDPLSHLLTRCDSAEVVRGRAINLAIALNKVAEERAINAIESSLKSVQGDYERPVHCDATVSRTEDSDKREDELDEISRHLSPSSEIEQVSIFEGQSQVNEQVGDMGASLDKLASALIVEDLADTVHSNYRNSARSIDVRHEGVADGSLHCLDSLLDSGDLQRHPLTTDFQGEIQEGLVCPEFASEVQPSESVTEAPAPLSEHDFESRSPEAHGAAAQIVQNIEKSVRLDLNSSDQKKDDRMFPLDADVDIGFIQDHLRVRADNADIAHNEQPTVATAADDNLKTRIHESGFQEATNNSGPLSELLNQNDYAEEVIRGPSGCTSIIAMPECREKAIDAIDSSLRAVQGDYERPVHCDATVSRTEDSDKREDELDEISRHLSPSSEIEQVSIFEGQSQVNEQVGDMGASLDKLASALIVEDLADTVHSNYRNSARSIDVRHEGVADGSLHCLDSLLDDADLPRYQTDFEIKAEITDDAINPEANPRSVEFTSERRGLDVPIKPPDVDSVVQLLDSDDIIGSKGVNDRMEIRLYDIQEQKIEATEYSDLEDSTSNLFVRRSRITGREMPGLCDEDAVNTAEHVVALLETSGLTIRREPDSDPETYVASSDTTKIESAQDLAHAVVSLLHHDDLTLLRDKSPDHHSETEITDDDSVPIPKVAELAAPPEVSVVSIVDLLDKDDFVLKRFFEVDAVPPAKVTVDSVVSLLDSDDLVLDQEYETIRDFETDNEVVLTACEPTEQRKDFRPVTEVDTLVCLLDHNDLRIQDSHVHCFGSKPPVAGMEVSIDSMVKLLDSDDLMLKNSESEDDKQELIEATEMVEPAYGSREQNKKTVKGTSGQTFDIKSIEEADVLACLLDHNDLLLPDGNLHRCDSSVSAEVDASADSIAKLLDGSDLLMQKKESVDQDPVEEEASEITHSSNGSDSQTRNLDLSADGVASLLDSGDLAYKMEERNEHVFTNDSPDYTLQHPPQLHVETLKLPLKESATHANVSAVDDIASDFDLSLIRSRLGFDYSGISVDEDRVDCSHCAECNKTKIWVKQEYEFTGNPQPLTVVLLDTLHCEQDVLHPISNRHSKCADSNQTQILGQLARSLEASEAVDETPVKTGNYTVIGGSKISPKLPDQALHSMERLLPQEDIEEVVAPAGFCQLENPEASDITKRLSNLADAMENDATEKPVHPDRQSAYHPGIIILEEAAAQLEILLDDSDLVMPCTISGAKPEIDIHDEDMVPLAESPRPENSQPGPSSTLSIEKFKPPSLTTLPDMNLGDDELEISDGLEVRGATSSPKISTDRNSTDLTLRHIDVALTGSGASDKMPQLGFETGTLKNEVTAESLEALTLELDEAGFEPERNLGILSLGPVVTEDWVDISAKATSPAHLLDSSNLTATPTGGCSPALAPQQPPRSPTAMSRLELELLDKSVFFPRVRQSGEKNSESSSDSASQLGRDSDAEDAESWVDPHEYRPSKRSHYNPLVPRLDFTDLNRSVSSEGDCESNEPATPMAPRVPPAVKELAAAAAAAAAVRTPRLPLQRQSSQPAQPQQSQYGSSSSEQQKPPMSAPPVSRVAGSGVPIWDSVIKELKNKTRVEPVRTFQPTWSVGEPTKRTSAFASQGRHQIETALTQLRPRPTFLPATQRPKQPWQQEHQRQQHQRTLSPGPQSSQLQKLMPPPTLPKPKIPARPHPMAAVKHRLGVAEILMPAELRSAATSIMTKASDLTGLEDSGEKYSQETEKTCSNNTIHERQEAEIDDSAMTEPKKTQPQFSDAQKSLTAQEQPAVCTEEQFDALDEIKGAALTEDEAAHAELDVRLKASEEKQETITMTLSTDAPVKVAPRRTAETIIGATENIEEPPATESTTIELVATETAADEQLPLSQEEELHALAELLSVNPQEAKTISDALAGTRQQPKSEEDEFFERLDKADGLTEEELVKVAQLMKMDQETARAVARFLVTQQPGNEGASESDEEETGKHDETDAPADDAALSDAEWERLQSRYFDGTDEFRFVRPLRDAAEVGDGTESAISRGSSGATGSDVRRRLRDFSDLLLGFDDVKDDASVGDDAASERSFDVELMRARFERLLSFSDRASIVSSDHTSLAPSSISGTRRRRPVGAVSISRTSSRAGSFAAAAAADALTPGDLSPQPVPHPVGRPVRRAQSDALRSATQLKQIVQIKRMIERRRQQQHQLEQERQQHSGPSADHETSSAAAQHRISDDNLAPGGTHSPSPLSATASMPPPTVVVVEPPPEDLIEEAAILTQDAQATKVEVAAAENATLVDAHKQLERQQQQKQQQQKHPLSTAGEVRISLSDSASGTLTVRVFEARGLPAGDTKRLRTDSYVKLTLLPDRLKKKTKVKKNSVNPVFDESFKLPSAAAQPQSGRRSLLVSVWHSADFLQSNQLLGDCVIDIDACLADSKQQQQQQEEEGQWHKLTGHSRRPSQQELPLCSGELVVAVRLAGQELQVRVKEAAGLAGARPSGHSAEWFVKLYLLPDRSKRGKRKTAAAAATASAVMWHNTVLKFDGISADSLPSRSLEFSVWEASGLGAVHRQYLGGALLPDPASATDSEAVVWRAVLTDAAAAGGGWTEARLQLRDMREPRPPGE